MKNKTTKQGCAGNCAGKSSNNGLKTPKFQRVKDSKGKPIRGVWIRGKQFYARLFIDNGSGQKIDRRVHLEVKTVQDAHDNQSVQTNENFEPSLGHSIGALRPPQPAHVYHTIPHLDPALRDRLVSSLQRPDLKPTTRAKIESALKQPETDAPRDFRQLLERRPSPGLPHRGQAP